MAEERDTQRANYSLETTKKVNYLQKQFYARAHEAKQNEDWKVAWCMLGVPKQLLEAFEVQPVFPENYGTVCAAKQVGRFIEEAEADGFSEDICSYARNCIGFAKIRAETGEIPPDAPRGGLADPDFLMAPTGGCDARLKWFQQLARYNDLPYLCFDAQSPLRDTDVDDPRVASQYIEHNLAELRTVVEFLEQQTGKKFDVSRQNKLRERMWNAYQSSKIWHDVQDLRKAIPSPMPSQDFWADMVIQQSYAGDRLAIDFYQELFNEVKERVDKGIGVIPHEKYRLMWGALPMWFNLGLMSYFEAEGAVFAFEEHYHGNRPTEPDLADPLRAMATTGFHNSRGDRGRQGRVDAYVEYARDYSIDGIVINQVRSCRANGIGHLYANTYLQRTLSGIPMLHLESDMGDARAYSAAQVKMKINVFIELLGEAAKRGQENLPAAAGS